MPVYEYHCKKCRRKVSLFVKGFVEPPGPLCPICGSPDIVRLFSTFSMGRSFEDDYEDILSDTRLVKGLENNDPRALAEWGKRMTRSMDDDGSSPEYEEMMQNLEKGRMPEEVSSQDSEKDSGDDGEG